MPRIPELNTNYGPSTQFDLGNALLKGKQLQKVDLQTEHLRKQNALLDYESSPEVQKTKNEAAILDVATKRLNKLNQLDTYARQGIKWAISNIEETESIDPYIAMQDHLVNDMGMPKDAFPDPEIFFDKKPDIASPGGETKILNKDRIKNWAYRGMAKADEMVKNNWDAKKAKIEMKIVYGPEGKTMFVPVKEGEKYDPEKEVGKGWSFANPKEPKQSRVTIYNTKNPNKTQSVWITESKDYTPPEGWTEKAPWKPEKPEKLTLTDVKSAYGMEVSNIKNRMLIEMTPEEQQNFAGQSPETILASLLAGGGKSLSPEKKKQYIGEFRKAEVYYGNLTNNVLGRKGVVTPKPEPSTKSYGELWNEVLQSGSSSEGVNILKKKHGYSEAEAKEIIRKGIKAKVIK